MYLVIGIVLAFILSFWKDNRSLWNPVLFLLSLISSYIYLAYLFYKNGYENVHLAFYVFAFVLLPILIFLSGIFLIYNAIILEDQSRTIYENLLYSKEIGEKLVADPQFLFVTNDYHIFRISTYARKLGMKGDGLGCRTAGYYIPSAFIREYVALCVKLSSSSFSSMLYYL